MATLRTLSLAFLGIAAATAATVDIAGARPGKGGAAVKGRVVLEGEKPELKPLVIEADKSKGCAHEGASVDNTDQSLIVGKDGGIANVVVMVSVPDAKLEVPEKPIELDQKTCRFDPHVVVVPVGATIEFLNSDSISHNVHTYPRKNEAFNKIIPGGSKEVQKVEKEDQIEIKCDIHPWMNSWIVVTDAPFTTVTDENGAFSFEKLPPGEHKVDYWHEKLGKGKGTITVKEDGTAEPVEFKMGAAKKAGRRG
jgi:plastocyanin